MKLSYVSSYHFWSLLKMKYHTLTYCNRVAASNFVLLRNEFSRLDRSSTECKSFPFDQISGTSQSEKRVEFIQFGIAKTQSKCVLISHVRCIASWFKLCLTWNRVDEYPMRIFGWLTKVFFIIDLLKLGNMLNCNQ